MKLVTIIRHIIIWQFGTPGPGPDHTNVIPHESGQVGTGVNICCILRKVEIICELVLEKYPPLIGSYWYVPPPELENLLFQLYRKALLL